MSAARFGLVGNGQSRTRPHEWEDVRKKRLRPFAVAVVILLVSSGIAFALLNYLPGNRRESSPINMETTLTWPLVLNCQHKDSVMQCIPDGAFCIPPNGAHASNDAKGVDGIYGTADDCPHCSCYCVPACISMIAVYRGGAGNFIVQDQIYDNGKSTGGENLGDGLLQTHGIGMFDGTGGWPKEVQTSFQWALGMVGYIEHNSTNHLTVPVLAQYIAFGYPVLWLDRDGWPANQSPFYPSASNRVDMGHAKVIAGWDDNGTLVDTSDDKCLIFDPWPEYNDMGILPMNATNGPGGTFDPYWLPLNDVLNDTNDIFLRDTYAPIPEFQSVLVPIVGLAMIAVVVIGQKRKSGKEE
jgi:hypothetical protein